MTEHKKNEEKRDDSSAARALFSHWRDFGVDINKIWERGLPAFLDMDEDDEDLIREEIRKKMDVDYGEEL